MLNNHSNNKIKILHLEDVLSDADIVERELTKAGFKFQLLHVSSRKEYQKALIEFAPDIILSDHSLPSFSSVDAFSILRNENKKIPFIVITATMSEEFAVLLMKQGISDYLLKDRLQRLPAAILNAIEKWNVEVENQKFFDEIIRSEKRYRQIVETAQEGIWMIDENNRTSYANRKLCEMFEYPLEEILGKENTFFMDEKGKEIAKEAVERRKQGIKESFDISLITKSGKSIWANFSASPLFDDKGKYMGAMAMVTDITARKKMDDALRESEEKFRDLVDNIKDLICTHDLEGNILSVNPEAWRLLGYEQEQVLKMNIKDILIPEYRHRFYDYILQITQKGYANGLMQIQTSSGEKKTWEFTNTLRTSGVTKPIVRGLARDITEKKKADLKLKESEEKFRKAFESSPDSISVSSVESGKIVEVNRGFTRIFGFNRNEVIGKTFVELGITRDNQEREEILLSSGNGEKIMDYEFPFRNKKGEMKPGLLSLEKITWNNEECFLSVFHDITEIKKAENIIKASQERFRTLYEENPLMNFTLNKEGIVLSVNKRGAAELGYTPDELIGKSVLNVFYKEDHKAVLNQIKECLLNTGKSFSWGLRKTTKSGSIIWVSETGTALLNQNGDYIILIVCENVTEQKKAEEELKQMNEQLRQLSSHLQTIREEERTRIAREIHDELGQQLTGIKMDLVSLKNKNPKNDSLIAQKTNSMIESVNQAIISVRRIATELRPGILDDLGLEAAIEWHIKEFQNKTGIKCSLETTLLKQNFSKEINTSVYRIFQESLTNIIRHAQASEVKVTLTETEKELMLEVCDNGIGITDERKLNKQSFGLLGMKERAAMVNGVFTVSNLVNGGVCILLKIKLT